eukprot:CAMPEP_0172611024 /NCGR_PEP_ID=MMETSP1068-20121228/30752_1 /TAXON_ID=35684 /ORGANISM="Pseudopedinella elastica, Strain CCMP716" /LENGTH=609 /DNA_ID=CAMNT_0013414883 /DNA_START=323 /DNA_END=2152 /DNA_ORIENTATION=+
MTLLCRLIATSRALLVPARHHSCTRKTTVSLRQSPAEAVSEWQTSRAPYDFIVTEIGLDGNLADPEVSETESEEPETPTSIGQLCALLAGPESSSFPPLIKTALEQLLAGQSAGPIMLPADEMTKESRAEFHRGLREKAGAFVDSKTKTLDEGTFLEVWSRKPNDRGRWDPSKAEYLRFAVRKERLTTLDAMDAIASRLNCKPGRLAYSGAKDKVAVTSQFVTLWRPESNARGRLTSNQAKSGHKGRLTVGGFQAADKPLRLGGLSGNRFRILLRDVDPAGVEEMTLRARAAGDRGFLNLHGAQRFGISKTVPNSRVGAAMLRGNFEEAVVLLLERVIGGEAAAGGESLRDPRVVSLLAAAHNDKNSRGRTSTERKLLAAIHQHGTSNPVRILDALPRALRRLFVESWQSEIWNELAKRRASMQADDGVWGAIAGDVVLRDDFTSFDSLGGGGGGSHSSLPLTAWELPHAPLGGFEPHLVTEQEAASGAFDSACVCLPLIGTEVHLPLWARGLLSDVAAPDLLEVALGGHKQRSELTLKGSYRHVFVAPRNLVVEAQQELPKTGSTTTGGGSEGSEVGGRAVTAVSFDLPPASYATVLISEVAGPSIPE